MKKNLWGLIFLVPAFFCIDPIYGYERISKEVAVKLAEEFVVANG